MNDAVIIKGLKKHYDGFDLDATLTVPRGTIVGLIGENGAGKSTTIGALLGIVAPDGGTVNIFGKPAEKLDANARERIGVVLGEGGLPDTLSPAQLGNVFARIYQRWDDRYYGELLQRLDLPTQRRVKQLSTGMKRKLSLALALAHRPELLVLDEPTSGLDPVVRDDMLDMFLEFMQHDDHAMLISSHITSDLEKIADYIVLLHKGRVAFEKSRDELINRYGILRCGREQFASIDSGDMLARRTREYECDALVADRDAMRRKYPGVTIDTPTIDEIMLIYTKGEVL